jgi:hypothetical protein
MAMTDPPQVVSGGGNVLATPKVQLIVWAQDPLLPQIEAALTEFSASPIWAQQTGSTVSGP